MRNLYCFTPSFHVLLDCVYSENSLMEALIANERNIFGFEKYPKFVPDQSRFPQDSFVGRWLHFNDMIDPRTLLVSKETLERSVQLLEEYKTGKLQRNVTNEELWRAQKIKQSTLHPDTGARIFMPFRMSGYVPFGSPMHTPTRKFVQGYFGAVTTAVSIAVGLTVLIRKAEAFQPSTKLLIQRFVPLPAVCMASTCNVLLMRWHENNTGIQVMDSNGDVVGTSKIAAKKALTETAATRAFLPAPIFLFPPLIMTQLEKLRFLKRSPKWHLLINAVVCTATFALALPVAIALFPQVSQISAGKLEREIRSTTQEPYLYYNKGL